MKCITQRNKFLIDFALIQPVIFGAPSKGWKSLTDRVAAAKAKPGTLNFASAGLGSASHWAAERLRLAAGINVQHIPFRGGLHRSN